MMKCKEGTVHLVGAGPGDPELLTIKADRLIRQCDCIVYDSLVSEAILTLVPDKRRLVFVGKRRGYHHYSQDEINHILEREAKQNNSVVRLKGGDPFLFGRGAEEAEYLSNRGIKVKIVPGITSGIGAPAYFGIPVTHRLAGSSVTFVAGHEQKDKSQNTVDWRLLAKATSGIVIYMGLHNLENISNELMSGGLDSMTPSVIIQQGTVVGQSLIKAPLFKLAEEARKNNISSPSIVMIGSVINYQVQECLTDPTNGNFTEPRKMLYQTDFGKEVLSIV